MTPTSSASSSLSLSFAHAAASDPGRVALVDTERRALTYAELAPRVRAAAKRVRGAGRAAFVATLRVETVLLIWACLEEGVTIVPLHPRLTAAERDALLADARPDVVIDAEEGPPSGEADDDGSPCPDVAVDEEAPLAIVYTSGTTGRPKGALLSRRAFVASAAASAANLGWEENDRWMLCMPLAHVGGLSVVVRALVARRAIVLAPWNASSPVSLVETISATRTTLVSVVPTMLRQLLDAAPGDAPLLPAHVRAVLLGGAGASPALLTDAAARKVPILTTYGLTEACSQVTTQRYGTAPDAHVGAGHPLAGTSVRIVDGEIEVCGPTLASGYLGHGPLPVRDGVWLRTGDHGRLDDDGRLHVEGRRSDLIVTGGENVYPAEVEHALERLPQVKQACVFGVEDPIWGQVVAAAVVLAAPLDRTTFAHLVGEMLAAHKRPRRIAFVPTLVTNAVGKVDRRGVAAAAATLGLDAVTYGVRV